MFATPRQRANSPQQQGQQGHGAAETVANKEKEIRHSLTHSLTTQQGRTASLPTRLWSNFLLPRQTHTCKQDFIKSVCNSSLFIYALDQANIVSLSFDLSLYLRSAMMADWPLLWLLPFFPPLLWLLPFLSPEIIHQRYWHIILLTYTYSTYCKHTNIWTI